MFKSFSEDSILGAFIFVKIRICSAEMEEALIGKPFIHK